ncbi:MAG: hypothetical protein ACI9G9_000903 [Psychromonas sp.]|jgi:hypothetical protein
MENQNDLSKQIFLVTEKIQNEFPELVKYLNEIPISNSLNNEKEVNQKALKEYLAGLNDLLETYANEHK